MPFVTILLILSITTGSLFSQSLSLPDAWDYSKKHSPFLQGSGYGADIAQKEVMINQSSYYPSVTLQGQYRKIDQDRARTTMGLYPEYVGNMGIRAEQKLFSPLRETTIDISEVRSTMQALGRDYDHMELAYRIGTTFISIAYQQVLTHIYQSKRERIKSYLDISQAKYNAGTTDISDSLRWESEFLDISAKLIQAENQTALLKNQLKEQIGMPQEHAFSIAINEEDIRDFTQIETIPDTLNERYIREHAIPNPAILRKEEEKKLSTIQEAYVEQSRYTPEILLYGEGSSVIHQEGEGSEIYTGRDRNTYDIGIQAKLPFYEGGAKAYRKEQLRLERLKTESEILRLQNSLAEQQAKALANLKANREAYDLNRKSSQKADAFLDTRKKQYEEGVSDITPILDAEEYATLSKLTKEQNRFILMQNWIDLSYALNLLQKH